MSTSSLVATRLEHQTYFLDTYISPQYCVGYLQLFISIIQACEALDGLLSYPDLYIRIPSHMLCKGLAFNLVPHPKTKTKTKTKRYWLVLPPDYKLPFLAMTLDPMRVQTFQKKKRKKKPPLFLKPQHSGQHPTKRKAKHVAALGGSVNTKATMDRT